MKTAHLLTFPAIFATLFVSAQGETGKLNIGIKKRVENCTRFAKNGDVVHVHYKGTLRDGTEFDNSYKRGNPFTFSLGANQVIKGWDQGLLGMCVSEKRHLIIPPELGYGTSGAGNTIPPNSILVFDVELIKIEDRQEL